MGTIFSFFKLPKLDKPVKMPESSIRHMTISNPILIPKVTQNTIEFIPIPILPANMKLKRQRTRMLLNDYSSTECYSCHSNCSDNFVLGKMKYLPDLPLFEPITMDIRSFTL